MQQTGGFVRRQAAIRGQIEHRGGGFGGIGVFQQQASWPAKVRIAAREAGVGWS